MPEYEVTEAGAEWASSLLGSPAEAGETYELDVDDDTSVVAAGWVVPAEKKKGGKE